MLQNVAELTAMQLGVGRHGGEAGVPDAVDHLDILDAVLGNDRDAIARFEPEAMQRTRKPRGALCQFSVTLNDAAPIADGGETRMAQPRARKPGSDIHTSTSSRGGRQRVRAKRGPMINSAAVSKDGQSLRPHFGPSFET